jgi:transcriptional regulator with XRE-family HTH domain
MSIGATIRTHRERLGLSQSDLARQLATDPSHVAHWESDRREPSLMNAAMISTALGISLDALVGRQSAYDDGYRAGYFQCREDMKSATKPRLVGAQL